jgi:hypothetical protein
MQKELELWSGAQSYAQEPSRQEGREDRRVAPDLVHNPQLGPDLVHNAQLGEEARYTRG